MRPPTRGGGTITVAQKLSMFAITTFFSCRFAIVDFARPRRPPMQFGYPPFQAADCHARGTKKSRTSQSAPCKVGASNGTHDDRVAKWEENLDSNTHATVRRKRTETLPAANAAGIACTAKAAGHDELTKQPRLTTSTSKSSSETALPMIVATDRGQRTLTDRITCEDPRSPPPGTHISAAARGRKDEAIHSPSERTRGRGRARRKRL